MKHLFIFIGLLWGVLCSNANTPFHTTFKQLSIQDGLVDNTVLYIHKDTKGLMWLGTSNGLSKYDGNRFINYSLSQDFTMNVQKIEEDHRNILYLQTNDWISYLDCKDESTGRIHTLVENQNYQVTDFLLPDDSTLVACDNRTLSIFRITLDECGHPLSGLKRVFPFELEERERFMKICIPENPELIYLVTNQARVFLFNMSTGSILIQKRLLTTKNEFGASSIIYHRGKVLISSLVHGIFIMDDSLENVNTIKNDQSTDTNNLSHNDVYNITPISDSTFLATTWSGYTMLYADHNAPGGWKTEIMANDPTWHSLDFEVRMISSYYDPNGFLWIGTHGGGVLVSDWKWNFIKQYNFLEDNEVESIVVDYNDRIYLSTYEQGILYSDQTSLSTNFILRELPQTDNNTVLCSLKDKDGNIWFGRKDGMILCYTPLNKQLQKLKLSDTPVNVLFTDSKNNFWIGTTNGLFLYNRDKRDKKEVALEQTTENILGIDEDKEGNLWIATILGLVKLRYNDNEPPYIEYYSTEKPTYTAHAVRVAKDGTVYIGYRNGLGVIPYGESYIKHVFTTEDGLGSNWINCLLEDKQGYIWIGTNSGFSCYDKASRQFFNYYISGSTRSVAFWKDMLCWGGNKHLLCFSPEQAVKAFKADADNRVIITGIDVGNKSLTPGKHINGQVILKYAAEYEDYISLSNKNKDFSLSFNNSPYPATRTYLYRLLPYQSEWIACKSYEKISYANLSPQTYTFQIKNKNSGVEEDITTLKIKIQPHWSQTWVFRLFILLLCAGGVYYWMFTMKRKHQRLRLIAELEHGIAIYKLQHQQEIRMKEEREIFFTKAAHELRPLLAMILSPLEKILHSMKPNDDSYSKIILVRKNVHLLHQHVDQLLAIEEINTNENKEDVNNSETHQPKITQGVKNGKQYIFMKKVIDAIEENIANENFSVTMLADLLYMSPPTLYRKTKEHFHLTVTEVIRKIRMDKAASLLAMQKYTISEIAEMVGYNDYETFRKHFKSQFGVSASKYVNDEGGAESSNT